MYHLRYPPTGAPTLEPSTRKAGMNPPNNLQMSMDLGSPTVPDETPTEPPWLSEAPPPIEPELPTPPDTPIQPQLKTQNSKLKILEGLNPQQQEAVQTIWGPVLIIAGPGSGKTRVLTHRIAYMMGVENIFPYRICAVTFTNKAAGEMRSRLERMVGNRVRELTVGTFHALGVRILRQDADAIGYRRDFAIYDDDDQVGLVKAAMKDLDLSDKQYSPRAFLSRISAAKAVLAQPEQAARMAENFFEEIAARVYRRYQEL